MNKARYKLDLVGVREVRWDKGGTVEQGLIFSTDKEIKSSTGNSFFFVCYFVHHRTVSVVKTVDFVSDRMSYIVLRGCWCNIIVWNVHAPSEEKSDDSKDNFREELEQILIIFPSKHTKILLGDFNAKLGGEDIFKSTIGNDSLHQDSNDNGVRIVNLATSNNQVVKSTMFLH